MRDVGRTFHRAGAALGGIAPALRGGAMSMLVLACGCTSTIERHPGELPDEVVGTAGGSSEPTPLSSGRAGANAGSAGSPAPSTGDDASRQAPPLAGSGAAGSGAAGSGVVVPEPNGDPEMAGSGGGGDEPVEPGDCVDATMLWFEDFETGNYQRWTSNSYGADWGDGCQSNGLSTETSRSPGSSQRSEVTCPYGADSVHRGYGGLQFAGDQLVPAFTNQGAGIDAPDGIVNTMWVRLDTDTVFENGKWLSLWTVNAACDWSDAVLTLGIEDPSGRLAAAHYQLDGGTRTFEPGAPALPRREWVRITVYVNYHSGEMHVWQNGQSVQHVTFTRPSHTVCQWHWGLYASADNDDIVLFEDDKSIWKLNQPWDDFSVEPYLGETIATCN